MKKIVCILIALLLLLSVIGCTKEEVAKEEEAEKYSEPVRVVTLRGPTGFATARLMEMDEEGLTDYDYEFLVTGMPVDGAARVTSGEADIAGMPTNMASLLYNRTEGAVTILEVNTLGVLYVIAKKGIEINSIEDLRGKTIYNTGAGSTPEYVLNFILENNGLKVNEDIFVEYKSEHTELAALLASGEVDIAVLPQPFVTSALSSNEDCYVALDLTKEWGKITGDDTSLAMGCYVVATDFLNNHPEVVYSFITDLIESTKFCNENPEDAAVLIEKFDIMKADVAKQAIPHCNIVSIYGSEMTDKIETFLQMMFDTDPGTIGGKMPDENFYYIFEK